jgi:hypothetical protein
MVINLQIVWDKIQINRIIKIIAFKELNIPRISKSKNNNKTLINNLINAMVRINKINF